MTCIWTYKQMSGDTTTFLIYEFNEYNELTKLKEFKLYDRYQQHWFEVKDGNMTVGYDDVTDGSVIYLYRGKLDGSEGDITSEYAKIKQGNWRGQDHHTVIGMAHGDIRRIVAKLNFAAQDVWKESGPITLICDHDAESTTLDGKIVNIEAGAEGVVISGVCNHPLEIAIVIEGKKYRLECRWNESFVIYELDDSGSPHVYTHVESLTLLRTHAVMKFIRVVTDA